MVDPPCFEFPGGVASVQDINMLVPPWFTLFLMSKPLSILHRDRELLLWHELSTRFALWLHT